MGDFNQAVNGWLSTVIFTAGNHCKHCPSVGRTLLGFNRIKGNSQNVCKNPFPQTAFASAAAKVVMDRLKAGNPDGWGFIEIMGCPGGCVNGGGQPIQPQYVRDTVDLKALRAKALYDQDKSMAIRMSHESPVIKTLYSEWYDGFGGHKAHHDLHTSYVKRDKYKK